MGLALQKEFVRQQTVVIGLGDTGLSVAQHLGKQGIDFKMLDTRSNPPQLAAFKQEYPEIEVHLGECTREFFSRCTTSNCKPGY